MGTKVELVYTRYEILSPETVQQLKRHGPAECDIPGFLKSHLVYRSESRCVVGLQQDRTFSAGFFVFGSKNEAFVYYAGRGNAVYPYRVMDQRTGIYEKATVLRMVENNWDFAEQQEGAAVLELFSLLYTPEEVERTLFMKKVTK